MPACVNMMVYDPREKCYVMRCIDGVSKNRPPPPWCVDHGAGGAGLPALPGASSLPFAAAAPGPGLFALPPEAGIYSDSGTAFPGALGAPVFPGFGNGTGFWVRDANSGMWYEAGPPGAFTPLPVALTPLPATTLPGIQLPAPDTLPGAMEGGTTVVPPPPPTPVPEPPTLALVTGWVFLFAFALWLHRNWPGAAEKE